MAHQEISEKTLIFLHIPKAAGTTFHSILDRIYRKDEIFNIDGNKVLGSIEYFKNLPIQDRFRIKLLKGHMWFGLHDYIPRPSVYITILRHPIDRIVSHYYYVLRSPSNECYDHVTTNKMTLKDFVTSGIATELDNGQVRHISGHFHDIPYGKCSVELLKKAKNNIDKHFAVVGISERFDDTLLLMRKKLGWKKLPFYQKLNVTKNRKPHSQISKDTIKIIEKYNELDCELYEHFYNSFDEKIESQGSIKSDLLTLQMANKAYLGYNKVKGISSSIWRKFVTTVK